MENWRFFYDLTKERQKVLIKEKEAEIERLIRKNQPESKILFNGLRFLLNNLGKVRVVWGFFLQKRNS